MKIRRPNRVTTVRWVTGAIIGHEPAVQVGRFDPQAAAGRLRVSRLSCPAAVAVHMAGEGGPAGPGERWVTGLYPPAPARRGSCCSATAASRPPPGCSLNARTAARTSASGAAQRVGSAKFCAPKCSAACPRWRRRRGQLAPALHRRHARPLPVGPGGLGLLARPRRWRDPRPV